MKDFLAAQLQGARRYDRIAGFFSSSLLEVAGEALERMTTDAGRRYRSIKVTKCVTLPAQFIIKGDALYEFNWNSIHLSFNRKCMQTCDRGLLLTVSL
ncbi:MAG: hypothetical protein KKD24_07175 [Proteobacteria bacterium]|nr:hypothetical protein [Pseudomonadota bacterium]